MTLHLAMEQVLSTSDEPLTPGEIAEHINTRDLYLRADRAPLAASQISARARKYPGLFTTDDGRIRLVTLGAHAPCATAAVEQAMPVDAVPNLTPVNLPLLNEAGFRGAGGVDALVPDAPGLYAIRVREFGHLPEPFRSEAARRNDRLIYIGEAKTSLRTRFLNQELRARGHGTFFRSLGAMLGYRPETGSLIGKRNSRNYTFHPADERAIIAWINTNLEVSWIPLATGIHDTEVALIRRHGPLLNLQGNPRRMAELSRLRTLCCDIATTAASVKG